MVIISILTGEILSTSTLVILPSDIVMDTEDSHIPMATTILFITIPITTGMADFMVTTTEVTMADFIHHFTVRIIILFMEGTDIIPALPILMKGIQFLMAEGKGQAPFHPDGLVELHPQPVSLREEIPIFQPGRIPIPQEDQLPPPRIYCLVPEELQPL